MTNHFDFFLPLFALAAALAGTAGNLLAAGDPLPGGFSLAGAGDSDGALTVHATYTLATKDRPAQLSITAEIPEGWHIFSITQKPGGPNPTRIKLAPSDKFKVTGQSSPNRPRISKTIPRSSTCRWKSISAK